MLVALAAVVLLALAVAAGRRDRERRKAAAATVSLDIDDWGIRRRLADGRQEQVAWRDIVEIRVTVLPRGPWSERTRIIIDGGGERGCIVPLGVAEEHGLVAGLGRVPGLDSRALADALDESRTGTQVVWHR